MDKRRQGIVRLKGIECEVGDVILAAEKLSREIIKTIEARNFNAEVFPDSHTEAELLMCTHEAWSNMKAATEILAKLVSENSSPQTIADCEGCTDPIKDGEPMHDDKGHKFHAECWDETQKQACAGNEAAVHGWTNR